MQGPQTEKANAASVGTNIRPVIFTLPPLPRIQSAIIRSVKINAYARSQRDYT